MDMNLGKLQGIVKDREGVLVCCSPWGHKGWTWYIHQTMNNDLWREDIELSQGH